MESPREQCPPLRQWWSLESEANNKFFPAEFSKGHIGIKCMSADLVDETDAPVRLSEVYLHHWILSEFAVPKKKAQTRLDHLLSRMRSHPKHYDSFPTHSLHNGKPTKVVLGKGAESRHTETGLPGPYVLESGNWEQSYQTVWILNVHTLHTRGAVNRMGCTECRCNLYNATADEDGKPLPECYIGRLRCCGDGNHCAVQEGYNGEKWTLHFRYKWEYVEWSECLISAISVDINVTNHDGFGKDLVEFTVEGCGDADPNSEECLDMREATLVAPRGEEIVYSVSHLHASTLDGVIYGEDGQVICRTIPMYDQGEEAQNENHYVVGIKSCYDNPRTPDAARIEQGEKLKYVVTSTKVGGPHTTLMALKG